MNSLLARVERLETAAPPPAAMQPEQRRARLRELLLKAGVDPAEIATDDGLLAVCRRETAARGMVAPGRD